MRLAYFDASILDDDGVPVALRYRKAAALVFYLATEERAVPRPDLAALFWPDADETSAKNNLRLALADVRKRVGDVLDADRRTVRLRPDVALENDLADFDAWARFEAPAGDRPVGADGTTPVLPGLDATDAPEFAEWVDALRERVVRTAVDAWTAASDAYLREGRDEAAIDALRTALTCRSWDEPTHRRLARLLASLGRRDAALAQVDAARLEIRRQLDQGPSAALDALAATLAARDAGGSGMPGAPPAPLGIVGRTAEILEIERAFLEDEQRAVVVPGAPGMGASTVAWAAARVLAPRFLGGVATWSARDVRTPDALAQALRAHEPDAGDAPALLFVDDVPNLAWLADVVPGVLERHPTLSLLATGRGPVDDVPAARIPVRGLPVRAPGPDRVGRPDPATDVLLRATRAAGATPPRDLGRDPRVRVAVVRSGGHPLTLVHLGALLAREGLEALAPLAPPGVCDATSDVADAPGLVEVFRPVVRLLPDEARATLATLGTFHGPVDRHAIRRVTGLSEARLARDVRTLQGHHLLEHAPGVGAHATVQVAGGVRTWVRCEQERVLTGERDAFEGLDAAAIQGLRDAHAAWIDDVVASAEADALGHDQQRTFARLEALLDDVDAALAHLEAHDRGADALRVAASAWRFHDMANRVPSALERLERLLATHGGDVDRLVRSDAENARGSLYLKAGKLDRARAAYEAGLALREVEGDARRIASSLNNLAVVDGMSNAFADAATKFRQVHDVAREGGEPWVAAAALVNRGHALSEADRPEEALEAYRGGAGQMRALGDLHGRLGALLGVVHTAAETGADAIVASTVWEWIDAASADGGVRDVGRLALPARVTAEKLRAFGYPDLARRLERELDALSGPTPGDATPEPAYRT